MTSPSTPAPLVLVAGHWLGAWAWDDLLPHLPAGLHATAVTLPGLEPADPDRAARTLDDQAAALVEVLDRAAPATVVAHSGANAPVSLVLDRRPDLVNRVVWVDSGPAASGAASAPWLPADAAELPLPPFDELARQASLDGLDDAALERFRARAVPEPGPVLRHVVELRDDARHQVQTTLVCCSLSGARVAALAGAGHPMFADVARLTDVDIVELPTGHGPMWSRPRELAEVIAVAARA